jgi:cobalt-zinc-cadmium efflux system protein
MTHSHCSHDHDDENNDDTQLKRHLVILVASLAVNGVYGGFELYLATRKEEATSLLADGLHNSSDMLSMLIPAFTVLAALSVQASVRWTQGPRRGQSVSAAINYVLLFAFMLWAIYEAVGRFDNPREFSGKNIFIVGAIGFVVNAVSTTLLHGSKHDSHNMAAAYWHQAGDLLSSVGVMIAGALTELMGWTWTDPVLTLAISALIIGIVGRGAAETWGVLLGKTPRAINGQGVVDYLDSRFGERSYHALEFDGDDLATRAKVHVVIELDQRLHGELLEEIRAQMSKLGVGEATITIEHPNDTGCPGRRNGRKFGSGNLLGLEALAHIGHSH